MTFWVHRAIGAKPGEPWLNASDFDPPLQPPISGKGYPVFYVEIDGFRFEFASLAELSVCIETLGQKLLPRTIDLSRQRGTALGPNGHWLSRLPAEVKPWKYRQPAVEYLGRALAAFEREIERETA